MKKTMIRNDRKFVRQVYDLSETVVDGAMEIWDDLSDKELSLCEVISLHVTAMILRGNMINWNLRNEQDDIQASKELRNCYERVEDAVCNEGNGMSTELVRMVAEQNGLALCDKQ